MFFTQRFAWPCTSKARHVGGVSCMYIYPTADVRNGQVTGALVRGSQCDKSIHVHQTDSI